MVHKLIISLIVFLTAGTCSAQGNFMFNQHGNLNCEYGNFESYSEKWISITINTDCINWPQYGTLEALKAVIDSARSGCGINPSFWLNAWSKNILTINEYLLQYSTETPNNFVCEPLLSNFNGYHIVIAPYRNWEDGNPLDIIQVSSGVITYYESY